jgi:hypothetical protein
MLRQALQEAQKMNSTAWLLAGVSEAGMYRLYSGRVDLGLCYLGLARYHRATSVDTLNDMEPWLVFCKEQLRLTDEQINTGMRAGEHLVLETVVSELLIGL